ncbi:MAG: ABC transporter ATP-binding protein, partial [Saprospiraceae bacterium]|nr:ABC transporter ATP-binding protein [Saprospiraceae bacterium]
EGDLLQWPQGKWQARRREFQMIFQNPYASLNPRLPIGEALLEPLRVHGIGGSEEMRRELVLNWL